MPSHRKFLSVNIIYKQDKTAKLLVKCKYRQSLYKLADEKSLPDNDVTFKCQHIIVGRILKRNHRVFWCKLHYKPTVTQTLQQHFHLISDASLQALQSILNVVACLVTKKRKCDRITATLRDDLYWLPIQQRISYNSSTTWCTNASSYHHSSLSDRNVCSCRCQHWAPVPMFSITW